MAGRLYSFQKVYSDLITEDGVVIILYVTWFHFLGLRTYMAAINLYHPDGSTELYRASHRYKPYCFVEGGCPMELKFRFRKGSFVVTYKDVEPGSSESEHKGTQPFEYKCLALYANCTALLKTKSGTATFTGSGYMDFVALNKVTRYIGLKHLQWGRIHGENRSIVFSSVRFADETTVKFLILKPKDGPVLKTDQFALEWIPEDTCMNLSWGTTTLEVISLYPEYTLHQGPAIDVRHFPNYFERFFFSILTGAAMESRWLSKCTTEGSALQNTWVLHEDVRFGNKKAEGAC